MNEEFPGEAPRLGSSQGVRRRGSALSPALPFVPLSADLLSRCTRLRETLTLAVRLLRPFSGKARSVPPTLERARLPVVSPSALPVPRARAWLPDAVGAAPARGGEGLTPFHWFPETRSAGRRERPPDGKVEKNFEERVQEGVKPLRGKRVGSAQSARRIQLGGPGRPCRGRSDPLVGPPRPDPSPPGAFPPRRCAATGSGSAWKGPGKVARRLGVERYSPSRHDLAASPGPRETTAAAPSRPGPSGPRPSGGGVPGGGPPLGTGPPASDATVDRVGLSSVRTRPRRARRAGPAHDTRAPGVCGDVGTHPTRLETRTKESNARASQRALSKPRGAMKVRAGARARPRWDPRSPPSPLGAGTRAGRTTGPSRPLCRGGGA
ncbi:hypothetical protein ANANG_G00315700 [Anguilla anguilla]|uniref:Uncharacterized protein n=1 Tax=Anguilla anguilla TaxID=7936 RepID=A0A9D3RHI7_ANGAN|nr:hypothetical protein ANANG_G00315700 [Anguilla anguilla]